MSKGINVFHETSQFKVMFPHLNETEKFQDQDTGMYSITMCFPKGSDAEDGLDKAVEEAKNNDPKVAEAKNF